MSDFHGPLPSWQVPAPVRARDAATSRILDTAVMACTVFAALLWAAIIVL